MFHAMWHAGYIGRMKERASITLSSDVLARVDHLAGSKHSRSGVIEHILRLHFQQRSRRKIHSRDLERINAAAVRLNSEADDVLTYQALKG
jgi:metal-responsive CopG/Arc/MetJ family transcriptional regulator